jgi:hypothetical protein
LATNFRKTFFPRNPLKNNRFQYATTVSSAWIEIFEYSKNLWDTDRNLAGLYSPPPEYGWKFGKALFPAAGIRVEIWKGFIPLPPEHG